jgi:tetratricopeptide (TPR) repeat protein
MNRADARHSPLGALSFLSFLGAVVAALALAGPGRAEVAHGTGPRPVVLVGLDAADWQAIEPLAAAGRLPAFARLREAGRTGILRATPPLVSPIVWTTIATGRPPEEHRVLDFMVDRPSGGQAPVGVAERRVEALWNIVSGRGRRVAVVGWWATAPAEDVNGVVVSDGVASQLLHADGSLAPGAISPPSQAARLARFLVRPRDLQPRDLGPYLRLEPGEWEKAREAMDAPAGRLYRDRIAHLVAIVAATRTFAAMAEDLLASTRPDLLMVYLEEIDSVSHLFVKDRRRGPGVIERAYRDADDLLAGLAARADPRTWIVVCSDHGFYPATAAIREDPADLAGPATAWHRPYGIVAAAEAGALAGVLRPASGAGGGDVGIVSPLDVAPTLLHTLGLPTSAEMPGRVVTALLPPEAASRPVARVGSYEPAHRASAAAPPAPDDEARERLLALGYVEAGTTSSLARLNLGEVLYRAGKLSEAEHELRAVVDAQPTNVAALLWLAKTLRDQGRAKDALALYEKALAQRGDNGDALVEAVDLAAGAGLREDARRLAEGPSSRRVSPASRAVARAIAERAGGRAEAAERELRAALAAEPTFLPALTRLLDLLIADGRPADARPALERAAEAAPASPSHLALAGEAALASRDAASAERWLQGALRRAPDADAVRLDLARAQLGLKRPEAALATLAGAPPSAERSVLLGAANAGQGSWAEAAKHYRAALERGPASPGLLNGLAWAELKLGRRASAAELLERSLALNRDQPEIARLLAEVRREPAH